MQSAPLHLVLGDHVRAVNSVCPTAWTSAVPATRPRPQQSLRLTPTHCGTSGSQRATRNSRTVRTTSIGSGPRPLDQPAHRITRRKMPTRVRRRSSDGIDRAASADSADRLNGAARSSRGGNRSTQREDDPAPIIPILARRVREVEARVASKGRATPTNRTKFQVVALLMRAERARVKDDQLHFDRYAGRPAQAARRHRRHPGPDRRSGHESCWHCSTRLPSRARPPSRCAATGSSSRAPSWPPRTS